MGRRQDRKNTRKISQATGRSTVYFPRDTHSDDSARPSVAAFFTATCSVGVACAATEEYVE